ncbi:uncharacterized protein DSM5745_00241 [Aspergillus mulundensis]|uniref:Uncharacterized protein n=1 Tax=Aspergillus mulundensis TaxID=1810919 RepID=A0A3D8T319_9EURO|nr:Uncharacterized protein DSM5745_00241 [Aspergillus mulundensis]RDW92919.1 Uncharacterized protein DSM5745_00241 [Aspergillus mulundensis]
MRTAILPTTAALALAAIAAANDRTTTSLPYFHLNQNATMSFELNIPTYTSSAASVISADATATTLAIGCLDSAPSSSCLIDSKHPATMIQGPSTWALKGEYTVLDWVAAPTITATVDYGCTFTSSSLSASCSYSHSAYASNDGVVWTEHVDTTFAVPTGLVGSADLLVTGGLENLDGSATSTDGADGTATETDKPGAAAGGVGPIGALVTAAPALALGVAALL